MSENELIQQVFQHFGFKCSPEQYLLPGGREHTTRLVDIISYVRRQVAHNPQPKTPSQNLVVNGHFSNSSKVQSDLMQNIP